MPLRPRTWTITAAELNAQLRDAMLDAFATRSKEEAVRQRITIRAPRNQNGGRAVLLEGDRDMPAIDIADTGGGIRVIQIVTKWWLEDTGNGETGPSLSVSPHRYCYLSHGMASEGWELGFYDETATLSGDDPYAMDEGAVVLLPVADDEPDEEKVAAAVAGVLRRIYG